MSNIPASERARAEAALQDVAKRTGFGPYKKPLPFIIAVAQALGGSWGLNGKRGNASDPSADVLAYRIPGGPPQLVDVLQDGGGLNKIVWQELVYNGPGGAVWIDPFSMAAPDPPTQGPEGPPGKDRDGNDTPIWTGGEQAPAGMPSVPGGLHPDAYKVGDKVYQGMKEQLEVVPKGTEDGGDLPDQTVESIRRVAAGIATIAAGFALDLAGSVGGGEGQTRRAPTPGEEDRLHSQLEGMMDSTRTSDS